MSMITFRRHSPLRRKGEPRRGRLARWHLIGLLLSLAQICAVENASAQTINTYKQYTFMQLNYDFKEFYCVSDLWYKESRWDYKARNPKSSAFGIPQLLNLKSKDPFIQIDRGLKYIQARYSTPCNALAFHNRKGYY